ncbi:MAG TPA: AgmX/PglI C-terminal domain-containing protein [Polyangiales bacterium]|nr:AgmX/PglI C-terminal domain-containing protein [Polyangiales bacterium]
MSTDKTPETQHTGTGTRPGAMTMAMQAVSLRPQGPKVLRIGIIQAGKIVEERVIRRRESVTVGSSEKNHFVIHTEGMPARFELFQLVGSDYILNFTNIMTGRVGLPGGVQDLTQMRDSGAARNAGTHFQVKLNDNSRGKVVIGNTTLLFQFVVPPPVQPRPQLPAAARAGFVRSIDWLFTAFMVFTFMSMFGFIVYLENADWPIDNGLAAVPEEIAKLIFEEPTPPPEEKPDETQPDEGKEAAPEQTKAEKPDKKPAKAEEPGPEKSAEEKEAAVAEKTARIAQEAAQSAEALIVGALSSEAGGALADVLAGGAVTGNAQDILSQAMGVGVAKGASGGDLRSRSGGGNSGVSGLGSLARKEGTANAVGEGGAVTERAVRGSVKASGGDEVGGSGEFDSNLVVQLIKTRLRAIQMCYEQQLRRNPTLAGKVTVEFTIQTRGNVTDVKVKENSTGDSAVGTCVANTVSTFRFNPGPQGGSVTYAYPFVFAPQN